MKASMRLLGVWAALLALPVAIARNATSCWGSCGVFDDERCSVSEASSVLVLGDSVTQSFMPALEELLRPLGLAPIMPSEHSDCPRMQTDQIHPTAAGQRLLALLAASAILQAAEAPIGEAVVNASAASCVRDVRYYDRARRKEPRWWIIAIAGAVLVVLAVLAAALRCRRATPRPESPTSGVALVPAAALA
ncbi:hypothetical protein JL720_15952 [Aureococcus anophagefferens]|nr:hypothetical protein JL720_15952 [Aureococcus anophagefferens]